MAVLLLLCLMELVSSSAVSPGFRVETLVHSKDCKKVRHELPARSLILYCIYVGT